MIDPYLFAKHAGYAHGTTAPAPPGSRVVSVAGQIGWDPVSRAFEALDMASQTERALANVIAVLEAAGARPENVVRMTWYVTDRQAYLDARAAIGDAWRRRFGRWYPAMTVVVVAGLLEPRALVEIDATAIVPAP